MRMESGRGETATATSRRSLSERAADHLRELIVEGELAPGERLGETALAARLGISRTPLREAFRLLAREGLVLLEPHRGARVAPLSLEELERTVEVMAALERLAGRLVVTRIEEEELREIEALHYDMLSAYARRDLHRYFRANQAIHFAIMRACRNPVLLDTYEGLNAHIRRYRYMANLAPERWREAVAEHEEILRHLKARDGEALAATLARHLEHKVRPLARRLRDGEGT